MGRFDLRNAWLAIRHALALAALILRRRPRLVYLCVSQNGWGYLRDALLMGVARALGCRVVTHLHGSDFQDFFARSNRLCRWLVRASSRWVAVAGVLSPRLLHLYDGLLPRERVRAAAAGIEDPFPTDAPGMQARGTGAPAVVGYLGMLWAPKGVPELLRALALLKRREPAVRLVVAGEWFTREARQEAEAIVAREGLAELIDFRGVVTGEAKRAFWRDIDLLVFPGVQPEGLPLVVLEAMAAARPVVATTVGAVADAVVDGSTGLLVPPGDPAALAAAIERLAFDAATRIRFGRAGRERFAREYTDTASAARLAELFDAALAA